MRASWSACPQGTPITAENARGKVVLRDFPALDRGYLAEPLLDRDMVDAGKADAAGLVVAFRFPHEHVKGYWDPHLGTTTACRACSSAPTRHRGWYRARV